MCPRVRVFGFEQNKHRRAKEAVGELVCAMALKQNTLKVGR
jgi:hypothetical protein